MTRPRNTDGDFALRINLMLVEDKLSTVSVPICVKVLSPFVPHGEFATVLSMVFDLHAQVD